MITWRHEGSSETDIQLAISGAQCCHDGNTDETGTAKVPSQECKRPQLERPPTLQPEFTQRELQKINCLRNLRPDVVGLQSGRLGQPKLDEE